MTVNDALYAGFARAHRRIGSIFLDVVWKAIWLAVTAALLLLLLGWLYSESQSIEVHAPVNALRSPIGLVVLGRELWAAYASPVFWSVLALVVLSAFAWILLEAYFRAGILALSDGSFGRKAARHFEVFLTSSLVRILMIVAVMAFLGSLIFARYIAAPFTEWRGLWTDTRAPFAVGIVVCATAWFLMTLLETLIRSDALDLLGRELFLVAGLMATLIAFESMIAASFIAVILVLAFTVSSAAGVLIVVVAAAASLLFLNLLHGYLLIVRFDSIAEMQRQISLEGREVRHLSEGTCLANENPV